MLDPRVGQGLDLPPYNSAHLTSSTSSWQMTHLTGNIHFCQRSVLWAGGLVSGKGFFPMPDTWLDPDTHAAPTPAATVRYMRSIRDEGPLTLVSLQIRSCRTFSCNTRLKLSTRGKGRRQKPAVKQLPVHCGRHVHGC